MPVQIPSRLEEKLRMNQGLYGQVLLALSDFEPWLKPDRPFFFPEYTNHGISHIEEVLETATSLIRDEAWSVFTSADAAALLLSVLLHDSAMHLTADGFNDLIARANNGTITGLDTQSWESAWEDFLAQANRFDGQHLKAIFGEPSPIKRPSLDSQEWNQKDVLLIGEFIRQHHPRLAHEIAVFGVPSSQPERLKLHNVPSDLADISGLIARSHGLSLRPCVDYLSAKYDKREYKGIHTVFLMSLLRISDYLQVQSTRAPKQLLRVCRLKSSISQREWKAHHAIRDIRLTHDDPESVYIDALPLDVKTFLRIKDWLASIQDELDNSWAVLGEVYGRYQGLNKLGMVLRRVRSNLDDVDNFINNNHPSYVPYHASFSAADAELIKLLIRPLYGRHPEIGIRELVQNAVDAVRELREYQKHHAGYSQIESPTQVGEVVVSFDKGADGSYWITVSDQGIGMTCETLGEYFLKAGASLRKSPMWRKEYEDEDGRSRVLRSGRFGIGGLAAFLMGDLIEVSTCYVTDHEDGGIAFTATLEDDLIEFKRINRPVGTTIRVRTIELAFDWFSKNVEEWDWYCLDDIKVIRVMDNGQTKLEQQFHLPSPGQEMPAQWRVTYHDEIPEIHWTYAFDKLPRAICNGINLKLPKPLGDPTWYWPDCGVPLKVPPVSIFDADGYLPLNLQRNELLDGYPFEGALFEDICKDFIAFVLVDAPTEHISHKSRQFWYKRANYAGFKHEGDISPWFASPHGIGWGYDLKIWCNQSRRLVFMSEADRRLRTKKYIVEPEHFSFVMSGLFMEIPWILQALNLSYSPFRDLVLDGQRILFSHKILAKFDYVIPRLSNDLRYNYDDKSKMVTRRLQDLWERKSIEYKNENGLLLRFGNCPTPTLDFEMMLSKSIKKPHRYFERSLAVVEWYLKEDQSHIQPTALSEIWLELLSSPFIPYNREERRRKLAKAYKILAPLIADHEAARAWI